MLKKKSILRLVIPTAICAFMFVPLLSGVVSPISIRETHATASNVVWEGDDPYAEISTASLPEKNPMLFCIEFSENDAAFIYDSQGEPIKEVPKSSGGEITFTNEEWASIKNDTSIQIWPQNDSNILKVSYVIAPDHTHGTGSDALGFYNWDGGAEHNLMPAEEGSYCLTSDIELQSGWIVPVGTTNLCLNGFVINANGGNFTAITIPTGATLNLYDCGSTPHYFNKDDSGLWNLASDQSTPTEYSVMGGCITGARSEGETSSGAICCQGIGVFNMYGGNIVGNKSGLGGGVYNTSTFTMYGGNICGNVALNQGGGVYCTSLAATILTGGNITENTAAKGSGLFQKFAECFAPGTPITMADGTRKAIEDLSIGDEVRVFDHDEGTISSAKLFDLWSYPEKHSGVMNLHFTNSIDLTVVYGHSFFEREENKYVSVTRDTVSRYVGHEFYNVDNNRWETLTGYDFVEGEVDTYVITSEYHLNAVANGMLSNEDGFYTILTNIFDYGENLKIDQEKKAQDIEKYGLYPFENFKHMSKDTYDILGGQYLSVAFGKGLVTEEYFKAVEDYYSEVDPDLFCDDTNETNVIEKSIKRQKRSLDPVDPPTKGLFVGGSIKILDNDVDNLLQESNGFVNIGRGTFGDGNGVIVPNEDMTIGISLVDGAGRFTTPVVEDYSSNFFSDSEDYVVRFNNNGTTDDNSDDYLELAALKTITNETPEDDKEDNNGYIEVAESAVKGDEVSVTVVPNTGYKLVSLKYNDGENDHDIEDLSFEMPDGDVSVSAVFEAKADQVVTIVLNEEFIYPNTPSIQEAGLYVYSNYYEKHGDGVVTVEFKHKGADDSEYTTQVPTEYGEYTVRVSVAEGSDYLAGSATADFAYSPQVITQVGFGSLEQPVAGGVAPEKTTSMLVDTKYHEIVTWDPEITTTNAEDKGIFDCGTTYTAKVTLTLKDAYKDDYVFADPEHIVLKGAGTGWTLSDDSTNKTLIYTKEFAATDDHSVNKVSGTVTCTTAGYKDAYLCENCGLYFEDEACTKEIGDANAYDLWKEGDGKSSALGHHYSGEVTYTWNDETHKCTASWHCDHTGCEEVEFETVTGTYVKDTDATCETNEKGHYEATFDNSNFETQTTATNSVEKENTATGHDTTKVNGQSATCTEDGYKDAYYCNDCGMYFEDADGTTLIGNSDAYSAWKLNGGKISASGHHTTKVNGQSATCTEDGYKDAYYCADCGMYFENADGTGLIGDSTAYNSWKSDDGKISASGHATTKVNGQSATCTEDGYKEAYCCDDCGMYFENADGTGLIGDSTAYNSWKSDDGKISASGHHTTKVNGQSATCTEDGYKDAYYCDDCGMYFEDADGTSLIGDTTAYNAWKANAGHLDKLVKEAEEPAKDNTGLIVGLAVGGFLLLLLIIYLLGYFFLYRKGKLDERKTKVIYKILPRGNKNLKEDSQEQKEIK